MGAIGSPFDFQGRVDRLPFIVLATCLVAVQQIAHHILVGDYWFSLTAFANSAFASLSEGWRSLFGSPRGTFDGIVFAVPISAIVAAGWALAALAFRRAATVGAHPGLAALTLIPFVQLGVLIWLALRTDRAEPNGTEDLRHRQRWNAMLLGLLVGSLIAVSMVIVFTLILGEYGTALFFGVPVFIGFATGYAANKAGDIGAGSTVRLALMALVLGAVALTGFALEGAVCLALVLPIAAVPAVLAALAARAWVLRRGFRGSTLVSISALPLLLSVEALAPPRAIFESAESVEIAASPMEVWESVVHMGPIPDRPAAPFGWGLAYPLRGAIRGSGVGAIREGVFSTGVAYERVTRWEPGRALDFVVLSDPPSLRELSPFPKVSAPHVSGYFTTRDARFLIASLPAGRTRLTLTTTHELNIGPAAYWQQFAAWAVHANKQRVLAHFRNQAERSAQ